MERISTANDLTERLQRRLESERREVEELNRERAEAARRELAARREERARYNRARCGGGDREDARVAGKGLATAAGGRAEPLARFLRRKLGDDAVVVEEHPEPDRDPRRTEPGHRGR